MGCESFDGLFRRATGFEEPFGYQQRLACDYGADDFPELVDVPTGLGKTAAVVLAWLWRRRFHPDRAVRNATPRRLVYCLPMRVLVEQTHDNVVAWLDRLGLHGEAGEGKVSVHLLMGGEDDLRSWADYPEEEMVLIGTQDMLLSRALMRGYGMSRYQWPVHFALLHNDALWVLDEVQLMGPGLATACQLEGLRRRHATARPAATLWVSATLHRDWLSTVDLRPHLDGFSIHRVSGEEIGHDAIRERCEATKTIAAASVSAPAQAATQAGTRAYVQALVEEVAARHKPGSTTLVVVNTVGRAQAVYTALGKAGVTADRLLVHGRFRPSERRRANEALREEPGHDGRIIVATQAVEAGVDLTSRTLFTELAPWSSLVQRFGRCNRYGEEAEAHIYWIDLDETKLAPPYEAEELARARAVVEQLSSASPVDLPPVSGDRPLYPVLRDKDLLDLFNTDSDLSGFDVDVSPYIRDAQTTDLRVFWRDLSAGVDGQPRPERDELCTCPVGEVAAYLKRIAKDGGRVYLWDGLGERWAPLSGRPRPGVVLMLDAARGGYDEGLGFASGAKRPVAPVVSPDVSVPETYGGDTRSHLTEPIPLTDHIGHVAAVTAQLGRVVGADGDTEAVCRAAAWHDVGKAHEVFQQTLTRCPRMTDRPGGPWAKSPCGGRHARPYFRHELASALAWLAHHGDEPEADLVAYLIAAHHGRVRMGIRALPGEKEPPGPGRRFARGIWEGDDLPALVLNDGERLPAIRLDLHLMELGTGPQGHSWTARTQGLLARFGPFHLAWLESLVRVADWRASRVEQEEELS